MDSNYVKAMRRSPRLLMISKYNVIEHIIEITDRYDVEELDRGLFNSGIDLQRSRSNFVQG